MMMELLQSVTSLPNLHPVAVHFPLALFPIALCFDLVLLLSKRRGLDGTATALYLGAAASAGVAYLAGRQAEDGLRDVTPTVAPFLASHSDAAWLALGALAGVALLRAVVHWGGRTRPWLGSVPVRVAVWLVACSALWLLARAADLGGGLVYRHGVAVAQHGLPSVPEEHSNPPDLTTGSGTSTVEPAAPGDDETRLVIDSESGLVWKPRPGDRGVLGSILREDPESPPGTPGVRVLEDGDVGIGLEVRRRALLLLPGTYAGVQVDLVTDLSGFDGTLGLAHHVTGPDRMGLFRVSRTGSGALVNVIAGGEQILDETRIVPPPGPVRIGLSAVGSHWKGIVEGRTIVHGHMEPLAPGPVGLLLDGEGIIRILEVRVTPLKGA
jgi:uncharacterized membrane protein